MRYGWCKICGEHDRIAEHRCPPAWRCWIWGVNDIADETDCRIKYAVDAHQAAIRRASDYSDEGQFVEPSEPAKVLVKRVGNGEDKGVWFEVGGVMTVDWSAKSCDAPKDVT